MSCVPFYNPVISTRCQLSALFAVCKRAEMSRFESGFVFKRVQDGQGDVGAGALADVQGGR